MVRILNVRMEMTVLLHVIYIEQISAVQWNTGQ